MNSWKERLKLLWERPSGKAAVAIAGLVLLALPLLPGKGTDRVDPEKVHLSRVQRGDLVISILQTGELMAKTSRDILNEANRDAKITWVVEDGAFVTNGQLLCELESSELMDRYLDSQSDVAEAEAGLKLAMENLEIKRLQNATDVENAQLKVVWAELDLRKYLEVEYTQMVDRAESDIMLAEEELKKARSELEGTQELFDKGYSNKNDLDSSRLAVQRKEVEVRNKLADLKILQEYTHVKRLKELQNNVDTAKAALKRLEKTISAETESQQASISSKKTRLEIERNQLGTRETQFSNTKIYADFNGQVFYPKIDRWGAQQKIEKGATVNYRQPILSFPDLSAWDIKVGIPEAMIDKVSKGQEAVSTLDALPGVVLRGKVEKISAVPDSQNWFSSGVKTYTVMVDVVTPPAGQLKPGMSATVEIVTDQLRDVLYIPIQAVASRDGKHYVYTVKRGRRELRPVGIGKYNTQYIEIEDGLEEGEEVLLYAEVEMAADAKLKKSPLSEESSQRKGAGEAE